MNRYSIGINRQIVGKEGADRLSHSSAWAVEALTLADLAHHIGQGHPWMPAILDRGQRRFQQYANYAGLLALDVDGGLPIQAALAHPVVSAHCALGIESASSSADLEKYRLVFVPPHPIEGWRNIRAANIYLAHLVGDLADRACKDASRYFFGAPGRVPFLLNEAARLPENFLEDALAYQAQLEAEDAARAEQARKAWEDYQRQNPEQDTDALILSALDAIDPDCDYNDWIAIGMALAGMGDQWLGAWDAWSAGSSTYKPGECEKRWRSFRGKRPAPEVVFGVAKRYGWRFPKRSWASRIADRLNQRPRPQDSAKVLKAKLGDTPYAGHEYEPGTRLATWKDAVAKGFKYILDQSGTGEGKSHDAGLAQPEDFEAKQLLYFAANHYDPSTKTLADWADLHGRHNGLTRDTMPDGSTKLRRAKRDEKRVVPANCGRTDLIGVLRAKNIQGADQANVVCKTCPLRDACQHATGYGYGFLSQRKTTLAMPRLRLHPDSAPGDDFGYGDAIGIWEEFGVSVKMDKEIPILPSDVDATIAHLATVGEVDGLDVFPIVRPILASLRALFTAPQGRYGIGHEAAVAALDLPSQEHLETLPAILKNILKPDLTDLLDPELEDGLRVSDLPGRGVEVGGQRVNLRDLFGVEDGAKLAESQVLKQWLPDLLRMLATGKGSLRVNFDTLTLTVPTFRHRALMQGMKANILLDATLTPEDAALMLGCEVDDIFVCRQRPAPVGNLKITQIADLGKLGMQRGDEQTRRLAALVSHLKATQNALVIDFKKYQADGAWWADSRGSNAFQGTTTLVLCGTPCQNLGALEAEYRALLGNLDGFEDWVNRKIHADILQGIGRLRANRRPGESLHLVFVSEFDLDLPNITQATAKDFTIKAASKLEKTEMAIRAAVAHLHQTGAKVTQSAIAKAAKVSQGYISRCFGKLLQTLLGDSYSKSNNSEVDDPPPDVPPLVWGAIDLADTPQMLVDTIADLLNGLVDPHHLLGILLSGPPPAEPIA